MKRHIVNIGTADLSYVKWPAPSSDASAKVPVLLLQENGGDFALLRLLHQELMHLTVRASELAIEHECGLDEVVVLAPAIAPPTVMQGYLTGTWQAETNWARFRAWFESKYGTGKVPDVALGTECLVLTFFPNQPAKASLSP